MAGGRIAARSKGVVWRAARAKGVVWREVAATTATSASYDATTRGLSGVETVFMLIFLPPMVCIILPPGLEY